MPADSSLDRALHAIADPTRRRILRILKEGPVAEEAAGNGTVVKSCLCAGDIEKRIKLSQPTISHHMAILTKAGLVEVAKQSQWRWYRRNEKAIRQVVKTLRRNL
jgi:ArsR family transcriptional regulator